MNKFKRFAWLLVFYSLLVILWGAWVRISHSGDGCGASWPLCDGQVLPEDLGIKKFTEFFHRLKSGLFGILVIGLYVWARRVVPAGHLVRRFAGLALFFTVTEALLGAVLVKAGLVASDDSPLRAVVMASHLLNSLALVAFLTLTADFAEKSDWQRQTLKIKDRLFTLISCFAILGVTGAIAALATTLFPSESLLSGLMADISPDAHYLLRLRGAHPLLGVTLGILIAAFAYMSYLQSEEASLFRQRSLRMAIVTTLAILVGFITLMSLSPVWLKLAHLTVTYSLWISLVLWLRSWSWK